MLTRRTLLTLAAAAAGVLAVSVLVDLVIPPASASMPATLYVDRRIGVDDNDGRVPEEPLATLTEAVRRAAPGTDILITGYGSRDVYPGTGTNCLTVVGTPDKPITIRRNVYTNTLYPAVLTTNAEAKGPWTPGAETAGLQTWSMPWPGRIQLFGDPDLGFVKIGELALFGYRHRPPVSEGEAAWWQDGRVYVRTRTADPNEYRVIVKDGDGICLSGKSRHVRIKDFMVVGAVHAVRVEEGAVDVEVDHMVRRNVLDGDRMPGVDPEAEEAGR
ncbi:twin-arginine translocation signal domain-containing protein [Actinopolymorpha alba]|uniref:twin-arginine translocation signal domain-containing protein n=1 Tax=Actinopolymorpha alba TaxID=533267 RepID=UPI000373A744|nr:twin-arginine translocation signal domain-containing protein [Actinopolymorpha alba]